MNAAYRLRFSRRLTQLGPAVGGKVQWQVCPPLSHRCARWPGGASFRSVRSVSRFSDGPAILRTVSLGLTAVMSGALLSQRRSVHAHPLLPGADPLAGTEGGPRSLQAP